MFKNFSRETLFHLIFLRKLFDLQNILSWMEKREIMEQSLVNMVDGREQSSLNLFFPVWFLHYHCMIVWPCVIIRKDISPIDKCEAFSYKTFMHTWSCREYKSASSDWLRLKNSNYIILPWSNHIYSINFLPWITAVGVRFQDSSWSIYCFGFEHRQKRSILRTF